MPELFEDLQNSRKELATTEGKIKIVVGLGLGMFYLPISRSILENVELIIGRSSPENSNPFEKMHILSLTLLTPIICLIAPVVEECIFRGGIQDALSDALDRFCQNKNLSGPVVRIACLATKFFLHQPFLRSPIYQTFPSSVIIKLFP